MAPPKAQCYNKYMFRMPAALKSEIPMTPDGSVVWEKQVLPEIGAVVLHAPHCPPGIIDFLLHLSQTTQHYKQERIVAHTRGWAGTFNTVYEETIAGETTAVKVFHRPFIPRLERHQGLPALRANVAVTAGISKLALTGDNVFVSHPLNRQPYAVRFRMLAPRYHAAILYGAQAQQDFRNAWVMSFEPNNPVGRFVLPLPVYTDYKPVLDAACLSVGLNPNDVDYDSEKNSSNILLRDRTNPVEVIKIDTVADAALDFELSSPQLAHA